jgi:hypothetical protein
VQDQTRGGLQHFEVDHDTTVEAGFIEIGTEREVVAVGAGIPGKPVSLVVCRHSSPHRVGPVDKP